MTDVQDRLQLYSRSRGEALAFLDVDPDRGLDAAEVAKRRRRYGPNLIARKKRRAVLLILADQFRSVIVWLLGAAAVLSVVVGEYAEAMAIFVVLVINTAIGFFTSWRAIRSMEALYQMVTVTARVRREGRSDMLPVRELTPGDIVLLESGDIVPADMRLLEAANLYCDESTLTGESTPVKKTVEPVEKDTYVADRTNMAFKGVAVVRGTGLGVVTGIGSETELGRIASMAETAEAEAHPLEKRLDRLGQLLVWITIALSALIGITGYLRGLGWLEMTETAIALAVAAVPEGLPVVATLALARGMLRLARHNTLIEKLSAVETLGATTIVLTDKTGTLTENRMTVTSFLLAHGRDVELDDSDGDLDPARDPTLRRILEIGALCNNAEVEKPENGEKRVAVGDPMELALLHVADRFGIRPDLDPDEKPEIAEHAFDPDRKMMATVHRVDDGYLTAVKGAPEAILEHAGKMREDGGLRDLTKADRKELMERVEEKARSGYRLIGMAYKETDSEDGDPYDALVLAGFVCLLDPLREDIPEAVAKCRGAGVRVVMMTGDHIATASKIAVQAGLADDDRIAAFTEEDLQEIDPEDPTAGKGPDLLEANVFARVSPESKLKLVQFYQKAGHVVAMTGDGVNDAPALKKADIGIAMGQRGTQVAREAAAMVLKDDAFSSIIAAMRQGRVIFGNIRRFVIYLMSCNFSEVLVVGLAIIIGLPVPLSPIQILFLNIVTDVFPAFALGLGEGDETVMQEPPRDPKEQIVTRGHWLDIVAFGLLITVSTLGAYWLALENFGMTGAEATTIAFMTLALSQLWHVFNMRGASERWFANTVSKNSYVWFAIAFCLLLLAASFYVPALADVMKLTLPGKDHLALALGASLMPLIIGQLWIGLTALQRRGHRAQ